MPEDFSKCLGQTPLCFANHGYHRPSSNTIKFFRETIPHFSSPLPTWLYAPRDDQDFSRDCAPKLSTSAGPTVNLTTNRILTDVDARHSFQSGKRPPARASRHLPPATGRDLPLCGHCQSGCALSPLHAFRDCTSFVRTRKRAHDKGANNYHKHT